MEQRDTESKSTGKSAKRIKGPYKAPKTNKEDDLKESNVLYIYGTEENKEFITELSEKNNRSASYIVNELISAFREKRSVSITPHTPKFVEKAEAWKRNHKG